MNQNLLVVFPKINADYELREGRLKNKIITKAELLKVMEDYWNELNGFTKGSNIACADHYEVRFRRKNDNYDPEQLRNWNITVGADTIIIMDGNMEKGIKTIKSITY